MRAASNGKPAGGAGRAPKLDRSLSYRLHQLHKLSDRDSQAAYLSDARLPMSEGRCLAAIGAFAPLSINDLAQRANLNKGQASRAAQSLVDQGLVAKTASETDGRGVVLALTRKGTQVWQRVMQVIERRNDEIFGCLSAAERTQLGRMFDRMIEHVQSAEGVG
jgi:DNA-binding MarR family transcriptional regulator